MREAPAVMVFAIPNNNTSISDLNVPRFVKRRNLAAQFDVQSVQGDWQFDDVGIFSLICSRFTATVELRFFLRLRHVMPSSARSHVCALVALTITSVRFSCSGDSFRAQAQGGVRVHRPAFPKSAPVALRYPSPLTVACVWPVRGIPERGVCTQRT